MIQSLPLTIPLASFILRILSTSVAADRHGQHHTHLDLIILWALDLGDLGRIKVRRVVLVQDLAFTHLALWLSRRGAE